MFNFHCSMFPTLCDLCGLLFKRSLFLFDLTGRRSDNGVFYRSSQRTRRRGLSECRMFPNRSTFSVRCSMFDVRCSQPSATSATSAASCSNKSLILFDLAWERRRPAGKIWNLKLPARRRRSRANRLQFAVIRAIRVEPHFFLSCAVVRLESRLERRQDNPELK